MTETIRVRVGVMDSRREAHVAVLPYSSLSTGARLRKGLSRGALISLGGLVVVLVPLLHLCGAAMVFFGGPVAAFLAWKPTGLLGPGSVTCPKCKAVLLLAAAVPVWPARRQCGECGVTVELTLAPSQVALEC
jgi:hypothetical protein